MWIHTFWTISISPVGGTFGEGGRDWPATANHKAWLLRLLPTFPIVISSILNGAFYNKSVLSASSPGRSIKVTFTVLPEAPPIAQHPWVQMYWPPFNALIALLFLYFIFLKRVFFFSFFFLYKTSDVGIVFMCRILFTIVRHGNGVTILYSTKYPYPCKYCICVCML